MLFVPVDGHIDAFRQRFFPGFQSQAEVEVVAVLDFHYLAFDPDLAGGDVELGNKLLDGGEAGGRVVDDDLVEILVDDDVPVAGEHGVLYDFRKVFALPVLEGIDQRFRAVVVEADAFLVQFLDGGLYIRHLEVRGGDDQRGFLRLIVDGGADVALLGVDGGFQDADDLEGAVSILQGENFDDIVCVVVGFHDADGLAYSGRSGNSVIISSGLFRGRRSGSGKVDLGVGGKCACGGQSRQGSNCDLDVHIIWFLVVSYR